MKRCSEKYKKLSENFKFYINDKILSKIKKRFVFKREKERKGGFQNEEKNNDVVNSGITVDLWSFRSGK